MNHLYIIFSCMFITMAACSPATTQSAFARLEIGDSFYMEVFEIKGYTLSHFVLSNNRRDKKQVSNKRISHQEVQAFWKVMENEKVKDWNRTYLVSVHDGRTAMTSWRLSIHKDGQDIKVEGAGAYPSDDNPKFVSELKVSQRFQRVYNSFKQ